MRTLRCTILMLGFLTAFALRATAAADDLDQRFDHSIRPFFNSYCVTCHGGEKPDGQLDLSTVTTMSAVVKDQSHWLRVIEKLQAKEMPPKEADVFPSDGQRQEVIDWVRAMRSSEARKHAGDPGGVHETQPIGRGPVR